MIKKKALLILCLVCLIGLFAGVFGQFLLKQAKPIISNTDKTAVQAVLTGYFTAWQTENPEQMYSYISTEDKAVFSLVEYVQQFKEYPIVPLKYEVGALSGDTNLIQATVFVYWPGVDEDIVDKHSEIFQLAKEETWKIVEKKSLAK